MNKYLTAFSAFIMFFLSSVISFAQSDNTTTPKKFSLIFEYNKGEITLYEKSIVAGLTFQESNQSTDAPYYFMILNDKGDSIYSRGFNIILTEVSDKLIIKTDSQGNQIETMEGSGTQLEKTAFVIEAPFDNTAKLLNIHDGFSKKQLISISLVGIDDYSKFGLSRDGGTEIISPYEIQSQIIAQTDSYQDDNWLNIVFLGANYSTYESFINDCQQVVSRLYSTPPFNEYSKISSHANPSYYQVRCCCDTSLSGLLRCRQYNDFTICENDNAHIQSRALATYSNYDTIIILYSGETVCASNASVDCTGTTGRLIARCATQNNQEQMKKIAVHEFAHSFGGINDEYTMTTAIACPNQNYRNCCSKSQTCPVSCGSGCFDTNAGCYSGCAQDNWYTYAGTCKMRLDTQDFCFWCQKLLRERLNYWCPN